MLRDATCQSFPVWSFSAAIVAAIAALGTAEIEGVAEAWRSGLGPDAVDADLHELAACIEDLAAALAERSEGEELFVLLEEKAW